MKLKCCNKEENILDVAVCNMNTCNNIYHYKCLITRFNYSRNDINNAIHRFFICPECEEINDTKFEESTEDDFYENNFDKRIQEKKDILLYKITKKDIKNI